MLRKRCTFRKRITSGLLPIPGVPFFAVLFSVSVSSPLVFTLGCNHPFCSKRIPLILFICIFELLIGGTNCRLPITLAMTKYRISALISKIVVMSQYTQSLKCKICSSVVKSGTDGNDSLLLHILKNNHVEYVVNEENSEKSKPVCCKFCGCTHALLIGYCFSLKAYVCIECIGKKSVFATQAKWEDAYSSWYPLALSRQMLNHNGDIPEEYADEKDPQKYALSFSAEYLHSIKSWIRRRRVIEYEMRGSFHGNDSHCCSYVVTSERVRRDFYSVGSCCSVRVSGKDVSNLYDGVVIVSRRSEIIFLIRNLNRSSVPEHASVRISPLHHNWPSITPLLVSGRCLSGRNINDTLYTTITSPQINQTAHYSKASVPKGEYIQVNQQERSVIARSIKRVLSVINCGDNIVYQAGSVVVRD